MTATNSYKQSGVDIDAADAAKRSMAKTLETSDARVLNQVGAFASLFDGRFPGMKDPVLVLKMEEPGSKQKLAFERGRVKSICFDMINHLINDIAVMGAQPLAVLDAVICGKLERPVVEQIVSSVAEACRAQGCSLVGGETSEQPGVLAPGTYVLTASIVGVVDRAQVIDGSRIESGDVVLSVASNGLHTNGYSLVRALMAQHPELERVEIEGESFFDVIMRPHVCYYGALKGLFSTPGLKGLAHITGGGIQGNLNRIIPTGLCAEIDLGSLEVPKVFKQIQLTGKVSTEDMLRTFNMGTGLCVVCSKQESARISSHFQQSGHAVRPIGAIARGSAPISLQGALRD